MTREETMTTTDDKQKEKIKTPFAKVIVDGRGANSYFSILYFDPTDKDFHIGYSSYNLNYVFNWLNEEFEIVEDGNSTFGHHSGKKSRTFWACFMKLEEMEMLEGKE